LSSRASLRERTAVRDENGWTAADFDEAMRKVVRVSEILKAF
jgi:hypothetical protein